MLDGIFLRHVKNEIEETALQSRVSQIYQPGKDELVFLLRTRSNGNIRLFISAKANCPRVHITEAAPENPDSPPMFCMLLRKKLGNGRLVGIRQPQLERILFFDFQCSNEIGDTENLTLAAEIMGKHSNAILIAENGIIIDSLKRIDLTISSRRMILPGLKYELPPEQEKLNILEITVGEIAEHIKKNMSTVQDIEEVLLKTLQGVSPVVCREIAYKIGGGASLEQELEALKKIAEACGGIPVTVKDKNGKLIDISFLEIKQYENVAITIKHEGFSKALDAFFTERDNFDRLKVKSLDLHRLLNNLIERLSKKITLQTQDLKKSRNREHLRIKGELLQANLYRVKKGDEYVDVENFYDGGTVLRIPLSVTLSPAQNCQKFYKNYKKAKTAETELLKQLEKAKTEIEYLESVKYELERAENLSEIAQIRTELIEEGFLKQQPTKQKRNEKSLPPIEFLSSDGLRIFVGRNNRQNDLLTLKTARNTDIWFHTKGIHGSHVIVETDGEEAPEKTLLEAASLAAYYSRARESSNIPVDYTAVRNVKKPRGAKPGMVIYDFYNTVYVMPEISCERIGK